MRIKYSEYEASHSRRSCEFVITMLEIRREFLTVPYRWPHLPVFIFNTWTIGTSKDRKIEAFSQSFNDCISSYSGYTSNMMVKDSDFGPSFLTVTSSFDKATVDSLSQTSSFVQDRGLNPERILDQHLRPGFNSVQFRVRQAFAQWFFVLGFAFSRCSPLHNETQRSLFDSRLRSVDWYMYRRRICICRFPVSLDFNYASVTVDQLGLAFWSRTLVTLCSPTMAAYFFASS